MNIKDVTIPAFLWYILPGINAICFLFVMPIFIIDSNLIKDRITVSSVLGWLLGGLIIGFLMDSMKLYKITFGYRSMKRRFMSELSRAIFEQSDASGELGQQVFRAMRLLLGKEQNPFPSWEHSRWVMINHTSKVAYTATCFWAYTFFALWQSKVNLLGVYQFSQVGGRLLLGFLATISFFIGLRLDLESRKVAHDANKLYIQYVISRREDIASMLGSSCGVHTATGSSGPKIEMRE